MQHHKTDYSVALQARLRHDIYVTEVDANGYYVQYSSSLNGIYVQEVSTSLSPGDTVDIAATELYSDYGNPEISAFNASDVQMSVIDPTTIAAEVTSGFDPSSSIGRTIKVTTAALVTSVTAYTTTIDAGGVSLVLSNDPTLSGLDVYVGDEITIDIGVIQYSYSEARVFADVANVTVIDNTAPTVGSAPADAATQSTTDHVLSVAFNEEMNTGTVTSSNVWVESGTSCSTSSSAVESITPVDSGDSKSFTLTFSTNWSDGVSYTTCVNTSVQDSNGNALENAYSATWTAVLPPIWTEDFETAGGYSITDSSGNVLTEETLGNGDYFLRTDGTGLGTGITINGKQGTYFFGAQDIDGSFTTLPQTDDVIWLTWTSIDISGKTSLSVKSLFAEDTASDAAYDWDADAMVSIQYNIDGGGWTDAIVIAGSATNTAATVTTGTPASALTDTMQEVTGTISGTGTSMDLRLIIQKLDAGDEDVAVDNIRVYGN